MALDFEPAVVALATQPFRLVWPDGDREREHTPDYFARLADGTGGRRCPAAGSGRPGGRRGFRVHRADLRVGGQFRLVGDLSHPLRVNLRWLARYRHPHCCRAPVADRLREVFCEPRLLLAGAERVGDRLAVLLVLYHLLWQHELTADLVSAQLGAGAVVCLAGRGRP
ncbi:TnsA-like heteromeric transposase endonuclease subunit [Streptomyces sp. NPDC057474]|uniref:TnsA-like heteromeric transposase endonuclease subunit n=1 Tax=Streptomyces sp. NPDC057474 TaxID=3346144 RepID=UPI0036953DD1